MSYVSEMKIADRREDPSSSNHMVGSRFHSAWILEFWTYWIADLAAPRLVHRKLFVFGSWTSRIAGSTQVATVQTAKPVNHGTVDLVHTTFGHVGGTIMREERSLLSYKVCWRGSLQMASRT